MGWTVSFFINSILFGLALAMDAFSVSLANGLHEPDMRLRRMCLVAGTFSLFQTLMPLIGWVCVHSIETLFASAHRFIPWIALVLLLFLGGKMLIEGIRRKGTDTPVPVVGVAGLLAQGVATSIDALSVGFTIADYSWQPAVVEALLIGAVTFGVCMIGLLLGKRFGARFAGKAEILGGLILIGIGVEIFITGLR